MSCQGKGGKKQLEIACASRGFHVFYELWKPKLGQMLHGRQEIGNLNDPFAIFLRTKIPGKLTDFDAVRDNAQEISRFCHYFLNYGGKLEARVCCTKYRLTPIDDLEIPILLIFKKKKKFDERDIWKNGKSH